MLFKIMIIFDLEVCERNSLKCINIKVAISYKSEQSYIFYDVGDLSKE